MNTGLEKPTRRLRSLTGRERSWGKQGGMTMGSLRLRSVLIGTGVMLALGAGGSTASASGHLVAAAKGRAAPAMAAGARVGTLGGTWGIAEEVPGTAALNKAGGAEISSVSCASAGNCSAGGYYVDASGRQQAFVVSETT